jgi:two-component system, cell cycle sensor histidine kinase and response regulator CckA
MPKQGPQLRPRETNIQKSRARLSEANYRSLFGFASDGMFVADRRGRILDANGEAARMSGYDHAELLAMNLRDCVDTEEAPRLIQILENLVEGKVEETEWFFRRKDGPHYLCEVGLTLLSGDVLLLTGRDITERRRAGDLLRESEEKYRNLFESIDEGFCTIEVLFDAAGKAVDYRFLEINPAFEKQTGIPSAVGQRIREIAPDHEEYWFEIYGRVALTGESVRFENMAAHFHRWYEVYAFRIGEPRQHRVAILFNDITKRRDSVDELSRSEIKYRTLVETSHDVIWSVDKECRVTFMSPAARRVYGYEPHDLVGRPLTDLVPPHLLEREMTEVKLVLEGGVSVGYEHAFQHRDGQPVYLRCNSVPIRDARGAVIGAMGVSTDITERKRAEDGLRDSEERFRATFEHAGVGIALVGIDGRPFKPNPALLEMLGYSEEEFSSMVFTEFTHPEDRALDWGLYAELISGKREHYEIEKRFVKKNRELLWGSLTVSLVKDRDGLPMYAVGMVQDVTERKEAERALRESEERFRQIAETIDEVFWISDAASPQTYYVSPAYERVWGRKAEWAYENRRAFLDSIHPEDRESVLSSLEAKKAGAPFDHEYRILVPERDVRWIWDRGFPIHDEAGHVSRYVGVALDITERKALEVQLRQVAKMQGIGQLAGGIAHDFNNLLTIINGYCEILLENLVGDSKASAYLHEISNAGLRAASLTRQLLAFSRRQVLSPQVLDLNAVVSDVEKMLQRVIGEDIRLLVAQAPVLDRVKADPGQIEQVIMNLAVNARDAMPRGGTLTIETSNVYLDDAYAHSHPTVKAGPHVLISFMDTGVGMSLETQAHIFEPFFTKKEQGKGTGLGLATVYGIVKQSEGSIWVHSELGKGTIFKVFFPVVNDELTPTGARREREDSHRGTETILMVEDEEGVSSLVRLALGSVGYKVLEVRDGKEALAACSNHQGPIHLLLTDVVLPQMSGPELAGKISALRPGIKVLFMSGYTDDAVVRHGVQSKEMPFIHKPFSPAALSKKIREALRG